MLTEVIERHTLPAAQDRQVPALKYKSEPILHLLAAKRALNERDFEAAREHLREVIRQNDRMTEAHNLLGVLFEMNEDYDQARKCYGRAIAIDSSYEPAQQNMRRIFELFQFGASKEPVESREVAPISRFLSTTLAICSSLNAKACVLHGSHRRFSN